jgi:hypothetical protein
MHSVNTDYEAEEMINRKPDKATAGMLELKDFTCPSFSNWFASRFFVLRCGRPVIIAFGTVERKKIRGHSQAKS